MLLCQGHYIPVSAVCLFFILLVISVLQEMIRSFSQIYRHYDLHYINLEDSGFRISCSFVCVVPTYACKFILYMFSLNPPETPPFFLRKRFSNLAFKFNESFNYYEFLNYLQIYRVLYILTYIVKNGLEMWTKFGFMLNSLKR